MDSETQTWERITNERLKYLCGKGGMVAFIKDVRPEWADYVRRADNNLIKTVLWTTQNRKDHAVNRNTGGLNVIKRNSRTEIKLLNSK